MVDNKNFINRNKQTNETQRREKSIKIIQVTSRKRII